MAFNTKLNLSDAKVYQSDGQALTLSGDTSIASAGTLKYLTSQCAYFNATPLAVPSAEWVTGKTATALSNYYNKTQINSYTGQTDTRLDTIEADYVTGGTNGLSSADSHRLKLGGALTETTIIGTGTQLLGINAGNVNISGATVAINGSTAVKLVTQPTTGSVADSILVRSSDGTVKQVAGTSLGAITGATNGLTKQGQQVKLGGTLTGLTTLVAQGGTALLQYGGEYWTNYVARTIPDAGFVTGKTSAIATNLANNYYTKTQINSYTGQTDTRIDNLEIIGANALTGATNGLTKVGRKVILGGALTGATAICLTSGALTLQETSVGVSYQFANNGMVLNQCGSCVYLTNNGADFKLVSCLGRCVDLGTNALKYGNDYSGSFIARSLPDAAWVTGKTSAITNNVYTKAEINSYTGQTDTRLDTIEADYVTGGTNGLSSADSHRLKLGGTISENTCLTGAFILGVNANQVNLTGATGGVNLGGTVYLKTNPSGTGGLLCIDAVSGQICETSLSAFGGLTGATNGIGTTGQKVCLGGALVAPTTINGAHLLTLGDLNGICLSVANTTDIALNAKSNGSIYLKSQAGTVASSSDHTTSVGIELDYNGSVPMLVYDTTAIPRGLQYAADYSNTFCDRSLVDKYYVDSVATGLNVHGAVTVATTVAGGNIGLSGLTTTVDGILVSTSGTRVLVKNQTNSALNGIYSASTGVWGRTEDYNFSPSGEISNGDLIPVVSGNTNANSQWINVSVNPIVSGDTLTFSLFAQQQGIIAGNGICVTTSGANREVAVKLSPSHPGLCFDSTALEVDYNIFRYGLTCDVTTGKIDVCAAYGAASGSQIPVRVDSGGTNVLYVDSAAVISSLGTPITTANNGLCKQGSNVRLGGNLTGATTITLPASTSLSFTDSRVGTNAVGLQYTGNYGANFVALSIPDAQWVTGKTATALANYYTKNQINSYTGQTDTRLDTIEADYITGATNGLCVVGGNPHQLCLGGLMTNDITIQGNSNSYDFYLQDMAKFCLQFGGINSCQGIIEDTSPLANKQGLEYAGDYSLTFADNSLITKKYVCSQTSGITANAITSANNGLTKEGQNVRLGGTLTGDTTIDTDGNDLVITDGGVGPNTLTVSTTGIDLFSDGGVISLDAGNGINITYATAAIITDVSASCDGLQYAACYSTGFTNNLSLVDKGYVDALVATSAITAGLGITNNGGTFDLNISDTSPVGTELAVKIDSGLNNVLYLDSNDLPVRGASNGLSICNGDVILGGNTGALVVNTTVGSGTCSLIFNTNQIRLSGATCVTISSPSVKLTTTPAAGSSTTDAVLVWNSSDKQIKQISASSLGEDNNRYLTIVVTGNTALAESGYTYLVNSPNNSRTLTLPAAPAHGAAYKIKDVAGAALTYPITIDGDTKNIDNSETVMINTDFGALEIVYDSTLGAWFVLSFVN